MRQNAGGSKVNVWFSKELDFFLPGNCLRRLQSDISRRASVKDIIESFGVPHTEVGRIRFNTGEKDFSFIPETCGKLEVFGIVPPFEVLSGDRLRPAPLPSMKFITDLNVRKLGRYLLYLGYDTVLAREESDARIAELACSQNRIILTRDTRLLFRRAVSFARRIRSIHPLEQLSEVVEFFGLQPDPARFLSRCAACNLSLEPVAKEQICDRLEPKTKTYVHEFRRCPGCGQIYWAGSHHKALYRRFRDLGLLNQD